MAISLGVRGYRGERGLAVGAGCGRACGFALARFWDVASLPVAQPVAQNQGPEDPLFREPLSCLFSLIMEPALGLNRGPADYESAALPLSYAGWGGRARNAGVNGGV